MVTGVRKVVLFLCRGLHFVLRHLCKLDNKLQDWMQTLSQEPMAIKEDMLPASKGMDPFFSKIKIITHGGGGVCGMKYLNCEEALEYYYQQGNRVFEFDVQISEDNQYILSHDPVSETAEAFYKEKIDYRFHPMRLESLLDFLKKNPDTTVIFDCKFANLPSFAAYLCGKVDESVRTRIVIQVFREEDIEKIRSVYNFKMLFVCMYHADYLQVANCCLKNGIGAVSVSAKALAERNGWEIFAKKDICVFAYTVNSVTDYLRLRKQHISGVFSDFLLENQCRQ